jgi:acyl-CoA reductase-like NAD-dependent aldehyde dehydrogenase
MLDPGVWTGQLYAAGWREGSAGSAAVIEVATGERLGTIGLAGPADVDRAGVAAAAAQREWARASFKERADVLKRAQVELENARGEPPRTDLSAAIHTALQTIQDAAHVPMGGMGESGNGGRYEGTGTWTSSPTAAGDRPPPAVQVMPRRDSRTAPSFKHIERNEWW